MLVALNLPCQRAWKICRLRSERSRARGLMDNCGVACGEEERSSSSMVLSGACLGVKVRNTSGGGPGTLPGVSQEANLTQTSPPLRLTGISVLRELIKDGSVCTPSLVHF